MQSNQSSSQQKQVITIIWFGMLSSMLMYGVILLVLLKQGDGGGGSPPAKEVLWALQGIGILLSVAAFVFNRTIYNEEGIRTALKEGGDTGGDEHAMKRRLQRWQSSLQTRFIISFAICEVGGLLGFVAGFMSRDINTALPVLGLATACLILMFPRLDGLTQTANRINNSLM